MKSKKTFYRVATTVAMLLVSSTQAAEHPLTSVRYDEAAKVNIIDLVMSIDWNIDNPPAGRDKNFVENILKQTSQSLYTMTEGRVQLGKVSIYSDSQFMDNTDIQYLLKNGRANASISGFNTMKGATIQMFAGTNESEADHGKTVAHELGHYLLGIFDEYREEGKKSTDPGDPQDGDTPRDTIMHNHLLFENISTPTDYADPAQQNTAHFRVYKQSAWETVLSPNGNEPAGYPKRTQLKAFEQMTAPISSGLTKPKTGWENAFQVVYMGSATATNMTATDATSRGNLRKPGPINLIVLDTTVTKSQLDAQINAAQQLVDKAGNNVGIAVYAHPYANAPVLPLTVAADATAKEAIKAALSKLTLASAEDEVTNSNRLFDWAETKFPQLFPAGTTTSASGYGGYYYRLYPSTGQAVGVKEGRIYYYDGSTIVDVGTISDWLPKSRLDLSGSLQSALNNIATVRTPADTVSVTVFSTGKETVNAETVQNFANANVAVNPVVLLTGEESTPRYRSKRDGNMTSLYDLADLTEGTFTETAKEAELGRNAIFVADDAEGDNEELIADGWADKLAVGETLTTSAFIAGQSIDNSINFQAFWEEVDEGKIDYTLVDPQGVKITPTTLPEGITYSSKAGEGNSNYTVSANYLNHDGLWTSVITANSAVEEAVFHEITSESSLFSELDVLGGVSEDSRPMVAEMKLSGPLPVYGAVVTADIYSAKTGEAVMTQITLLDNGVAPDTMEEDGVYTADLSALPTGEYEMIGKATNSNGTAIFTTAGSRKKGADQPSEPLPPFERTVFFNFVKEL